MPPRAESALSVVPREPAVPKAAAPKAAEPQTGAPAAEAPPDLETLRAAWPTILKEVEQQSPLLLESIQRFAPVACKDGCITLKGALDESFMQERLRESSMRLAGYIRKGLGLAESQRLEIDWDYGGLAPGEEVAAYRRTHLDATSRFDELKREQPLVDELYRRMGGRLLKGGPLS